jgi:hypothetical protein
MLATIASFKIDFYQFLSPDGRLISDDVPSLATDWIAPTRNAAYSVSQHCYSGTRLQSGPLGAWTHNTLVVPCADAFELNFGCWYGMPERGMGAANGDIARAAGLRSELCFAGHP